MPKSLPLVALLALLAATGCAARMAVPEDLSANAELPVTKEKAFLFTKALRFGSFRAHELERSWTSSDRIGVGRFGMSGAKQEYGFRLAAQDADAGVVRCQTRFEGVQFAFGPGEVSHAHTRLDCSLSPVGSGFGSVGHLSLPAVTDKWSRGELRFDTLALEVRPIARYENKSAFESVDPIGFSFAQAGKVIGAVQTINGGRVWIDPAADAPTRAALASAAGALLLFEDIDPHGS